jgi:LEA14-like dessication related protein
MKTAAVAFLMMSVAALLGGCASFGTKLETPHLSIVTAELVKGDLFEQRLRVRMRVQNPNDRELAVNGITYGIEVAGQELGRGMTSSSFVVPRLGEAEFDMNINVNLAAILMRLAAQAQANHGSPPDALDYRIVGKVSLAKGLLRSIPFEEKGKLNLH